MKKKIKQHIFVDDAFGEGEYAIPIISLQHPLKEAEDAYMLGKEVWKETYLLRKCDRLAEESVYVTATIEYKKVKKRRVITKMKIIKIELDLE